MLNSQFIRVQNRSEYPPQEKNPKGEVHEDEGFISYDRARQRLVLRQFHVEGFVNQYVQESDSPWCSRANRSRTFQPAGALVRRTSSMGLTSSRKSSSSRRPESPSPSTHAPIQPGEVNRARSKRRPSRRPRSWGRAGWSHSASSRSGSCVQPSRADRPGSAALGTVRTARISKATKRVVRSARSSVPRTMFIAAVRSAARA